MSDAYMISDDEALRVELSGFLDGVEQAAALNPKVALATGHEIVERLHHVIDQWGDLTDEQRADVRRTVEHVVDPNDGSHDFFQADGLVDDEAEVARLEVRLNV